MPTTDLDSFETRLLSELRGVVAERAAQPTASAPPPDGRRPWRRGLAVAAAGALLAVGGGVWLTTSTATPAFAVTPEADGSITVTVNRLEGADALEAALAREGIKADVTYTEPGTMCALDRYTPATPSEGWLSSASDVGGGQSLTVPASIADSGLTLVIESSWQDGPQQASWTLGVGYATGEIGACEQLPADEVFAQLPTTAPEPTITRDDTPGFTGPWAEEFTRTWQDTTTDRQRAILADGTISDAEYAELADALVTCMADKGFRVRRADPAEGTGYAVENFEGSDPALSAADWACQRDTIGGVTSLADQIRRNPDHLDESTIMAACLVRLGAEQPGYTADDYRRDMTGPSVTSDSVGTDAFTACHLDPLHAQP